MMGAATTEAATHRFSRRVRLFALAGLAVVLIIGSWVALTTLTRASYLREHEAADEGYGPLDGLTFDYGVSIYNGHDQPMSLSRLNFAGGLAPDLHIVGYAIEQDGREVEDENTRVGWPITNNSGKPLAGLTAKTRIPPHRWAQLYIGVRPTAPGIYFFRDSVVSARLVGPHGSSKPFYPDGNPDTASTAASVCSGVSDRVCQDADQIDNDVADEGGRLLVSLNPRFQREKEQRASGFTGYFLAHQGQGGSAKYWVTDLNGHSDYLSGVANLHPGWHMNAWATAPSTCSRGQNGAHVDIWTERPQVLTEARVWTRDPVIYPATDAGNEPEPPFQPEETSGIGAPGSGPVEVFIRANCSWEVWAYSSSGRISW
jgi:hypothetical protein